MKVPIGGKIGKRPVWLRLRGDVRLGRMPGLVRYVPIAILVLVVNAGAQVSQSTRFSIIGSMVATEGAARIPLPLGKSGVELSVNGTVNRDKLQKEIAENGQAILPGRVVSITAIDFNDKSIEFEIDGGGTKKKNILSNIQIGVGGGTSSQDKPQKEKETPPAKGSKITLLFSGKLPPDLTADELKDFLSPVLDFSKQSLLRTGIEALPPEFQEAVKNKEALVGMDPNTVLLAMGQPNRRRSEKNSDGVEQEDWIYNGRGRRVTLVTFEKDVVVKVTQY
jgi:hypothetical protein